MWVTVVVEHKIYLRDYYQAEVVRYCPKNILSFSVYIWTKGQEVSM